MPCLEVAHNVIVCGPPRGIYRHKTFRCWNCEQTRRHVVMFMGSWYGENWWCLACGEETCSEGPMPRPFKPRWRKENIAKAKEMWANALTPRQYKAKVRADWEAYA